MTRIFLHHRTLILTAFLALLSFGLLLGTVETAFAQTNVQKADLTTPGSTNAGANISGLPRLGMFLGTLLMSLGGFILWMGGSLLDTSISYLIVNLSGLIGNGTDIGNAINAIWTVVRDICNLVFIFGFIYIGIRTIIDYESSTTKRMLASIIIAAFLINFSLLITKIVIDAGNYIAVEIHNTLSTNGSIAGSFAQTLGVKSFFAFPEEQGEIERFVNQNTTANISFFFMATIMLIVAGFVLAAGGILLIVRFVALILILCFSPLLFAATIFPATKGTADDLWKKLIHYSFFAPAYLFMLFISLSVLNGVMTAITKGADFGQAFGGNQEAFGIVITFAITIFFLIMSLQVATKFGVAGGDRAIAIGNQLRGYGQKALGGATFGAGAALSRATAGRAGNYAAEKTKLKDYAAKSGIGGWAARRTLSVANKAADSSFDARKIGGVGGKLGIGEGAKGGYQTQMKEIKKKELEYAKSLDEVDDDDEQVAEYKKQWEEAQVTSRAERGRLQNELKQIQGTGDEAKRLRAEKQKEIDALQANEDEARQKYEREKQRRQIGGASQIDSQKAVKAAKEALDQELAGLKEVQNQWTLATTEAEREMIGGMIMSLHAQVKTAKKNYKESYKEASKTGGYASVVQDQGVKSWITGKLAVQNYEAGKGVRKEFEKKIKKSKEDSRNDSLIDAVKSSGAKDSH